MAYMECLGRNRETVDRSPLGRLVYVPNLVGRLLWAGVRILILMPYEEAYYAGPAANEEIDLENRWCR